MRPAAAAYGSQRGDLRSAGRGCQAANGSRGAPRMLRNTISAVTPSWTRYGVALLIRGPSSVARPLGSHGSRICAAPLRDASRPGHERVRRGRHRRQGGPPSNCLSLDRIFPTAPDLPVVLICRRQHGCAVGQIRSTTSRIPRPITRGVSRSSRTLDAGSGGREACNRRLRVSRTAKSCGPDASTLAPSWRRCSRIAPATETPSPISGESMKEAVKPSRRECRNVSGEPVAHTCVFFFTQDYGRAGAPGIPCAL